MNAIALLLAAGGSERMGSPKALLPWRGQPLISHQVQQIQKSRISECVVVLGQGADRLERLLAPPLRPAWKARTVINPSHASGKCSSILAGLTSLASRPDAVLIVSVDQPVEHALLDALLAAGEAEWERHGAASRRSIVLPAFEGRRGHPPLFEGGLVGELMGITEESRGLRAVVRRRPERVMELPWPDSDVLLNLNRPLDVPPIDRRSHRPQV